jgi:hypothetical protein
MNTPSRNRIIKYNRANGQWVPEYVNRQNKRLKKAAEEAFTELIQENGTKESDERTGKLDEAENTKALLRKAEEIAKKYNYITQPKETPKHFVKQTRKQRATNIRAVV